MTLRAASLGPPARLARAPLGGLRPPAASLRFAGSRRPPWEGCAPGPGAAAGPHPGRSLPVASLPPHKWLCAAARPRVRPSASASPSAGLFGRFACCRAASLRSPASGRRARSARLASLSPRSRARPRARFRAPSALAAAVCLRPRPCCAAAFLVGRPCSARAWALCSASARGGPLAPLRASVALAPPRPPRRPCGRLFPLRGGRGLVCCARPPAAACCASPGRCAGRGVLPRAPPVPAAPAGGSGERVASGGPLAPRCVARASRVPLAGPPPGLSGPPRTVPARLTFLKIVNRGHTRTVCGRFRPPLSHCPASVKAAILRTVRAAHGAALTSPGGKFARRA